jgi:hypothetical protein
MEERWYPAAAPDDLRGIPAGAIHDTRLYHCLDRVLPHKVKLEQHLKERYGELFAARAKPPRIRCCSTATGATIGLTASKW